MGKYRIKSEILSDGSEEHTVEVKVLFGWYKTYTEFVGLGNVVHTYHSHKSAEDKVKSLLEEPVKSLQTSYTYY